MLGDFVQVKSCTCPNAYRVIKIDLKPKPGEYPIHVDRPADGLPYTYLDWDEIEPIPLIEEMLTKNNWYQSKCGDKTLYFIPNKLFYLVNLYKGYMTIGVLINGKMLNLFSIKYVHELQHVLYLLELVEWADNFTLTLLETEIDMSN